MQESDSRQRGEIEGSGGSPQSPSQGAVATESVALDLTKPLPPEMWPNIDHIVTEDDTPVDSIFSEKQQRLLTEPLYTSWEGPGDGGTFIALANVGLFYAIRQPPFVPDMLLSLGVKLPADLHPKPNRSYFVWEYGKAPETTIEIVSNREGGEDTVKLTGYARIGISYYAIYDPEQWLSDRVLRVFRRDPSGIYLEMQEPYYLPGAKLGLRLWTGSYEGHENTWLRWADREGRLIPTGAERVAQELARADQEHRRAEEQTQRADMEKQRAETENTRAEQEKERAEQEKERAEREKERAETERARAEQERERADRLEEQLKRMGERPEP